MGRFDFSDEVKTKEPEKTICIPEPKIDDLRNEIELIIMDFKESLNTAKDLLKNSKAA